MTITESRPIPDPDRNAADALDGPALEAVSRLAQGTANPSGASDEPANPIDQRDPDWRSSAVWHLRKLRDLEQKKHDTRKAFDDEIRRLEEQRDYALRPIQNKIDWHRAPLLQLHAAVLKDDPSQKTIVLPYGQLKSRTPQTPRVWLQETDEFVEWARTHAPHLVVPKFRPDLKALGSAVGDTLVPLGEPRVGWSVDLSTAEGEIVPGVRLAIEDTTFSIQLDGEL